jgi:hypothetical protein
MNNIGVGWSDIKFPIFHSCPGAKVNVGTASASVCEAHQRERLERLCRYITRPPIATQRLSVDSQGRVVYTYRHPFRDGSTHVVLEPLDFIARLAALVPRPRLNLTRFHGVFAPNFKYRHQVVPRRPPGRVDSDKPRAPMTWPLRHIPVLRGTGTSCPMDVTPQTGVRHRSRDVSRMRRAVAGGRFCASMRPRH